MFETVGDIWEYAASVAENVVTVFANVVTSEI